MAAAESLPNFLPTAPQQPSDTSSDSVSGDSAPQVASAFHPHPQSGPYPHSAPLAMPSSLPLPPFPHGHGMLGLTASMANMSGLGMSQAYPEVAHSMERPSPPWSEAYPLPPVTLVAPPFHHGVMSVPVDNVAVSTQSALGFIPGPGVFAQPGQNTIPAPPPGQRLPRPHPFLCHPIIYLSEVPSSVREFDIAGILERQGVPPVAVHLCESPQRQERLWPNVYYEWMNKTGTITFGSLGDAEKAQAILVNHSYLVCHLNIVVSLFSPPITHPLPPAPVAPRLIRPMIFKGDVSHAALPSEGQIWDTIRGWGSIRHISVLLEVTQNSSSSPRAGEYRWRAKVEFWHEDEAAMFEQGFTRMGGSIAGWQVDIRRDPSYIPFTPLPFHQHSPAVQNQPMPPMATVMSGTAPAECATDETSGSGQTPKPSAPKEVSVSDESQGTADAKAAAPYSAVLKASPPKASGGDTLPTVQVLQQPSFLPGTGQTMPNGASGIEPIPPLSPPNSAKQFVSPWSSHNSNTFVPLTPPYPTDSLPSDRRTGSYGKRRGNNHKGSSRVGWRNVPGGVVGDDGTVIQHGPGQQIHPSPTQGPGSNSQTGLVDYCNLIVKNLDPDIAGPFLRDSFAPFGQVVNARVMRDDCGRSRSYGFVSFLRPHEASQALNQMNGAKLGSRVLYVAYHQPRRNFNKAFTHMDDTKRANFAIRRKDGGFIPRHELEGITLNELAAKNPTVALNFVIRGGDKLCNRLGIGKIHADIPPGTKVDTICHIHKSAASGESKSRTLQRIKEYINGLSPEDEAAMRELLSYPALVDAMVLRQAKS